MFEWMSLHKRDFFPKNLETVTLRPWDDFFWYVEVGQIAPVNLVVPAAWPPPKNTIAANNLSS